jgi:hypothetical protein
MRVVPVTVIVLLAAASAACGGSGGSTQAEASTLPRGSEPVKLDPSRFTSTIDNRYWPMKPGARWVYRETDAEGARQRIEVTVTGRTTRILGIDARVVHDRATEDGRLVEDTYDWYAQDADGNVWYLGEDTKEYEDGVLKSTEGSWRAGVDGAQPGVIVPAAPVPGLTYRQEYLAGEAEDAAKVLAVDERASAPVGSFAHVLVTSEFTPLEPKLVEHKFYAPGVGPVLALTVSGGSDRESLIRYDPAR